MPTKLQISLDAEKYQQNLNKVVANTRSAATKMTGNLNATGKDLGKTITIPSESTWKKASNGIRESGMPYDRVIHELPLSLLCNFYVAWRRREGVDGDKIRRPQNEEIVDRINARVEELGKEFLESFKSQVSSLKFAEC